MTSTLSALPEVVSETDVAIETRKEQLRSRKLRKRRQFDPSYESATDRVYSGDLSPGERSSTSTVLRRERPRVCGSTEEGVENTSPRGRLYGGSSLYGKENRAPRVLKLMRSPGPGL